LNMARFEWAQVVAFDGPANPPILPDDVLDIPPGALRFGLQPYLSLLQLDYAVDEFLLAVKTRDAGGLRGEASNAVEAAKATKRRKRIRPPRREQVYLAVHRHDNRLYYKRLDADACAILSALGRGMPVETACAEAVAASQKSGVDWPAQIKAWFGAWSAFGWFCRPL
ncbi:MAG: DUF2063 domain-containing protein, partial [Verrucomicrobia bacterium]|nr:DUF2063 domain-containing protein [Verrucomicrobiota bacterium]